jgi:hypothetical protein
MAAALQQNTVQKAQQFLAGLDVHPPPYATSQEVVEMLVARVRERRDQIAFRLDLQALIRSLDADDGHLAAPGCETRSPEALANELELLLTDTEISASMNPALRGSLGALVAAMLWAATSTGCQSTEDCIEDVSVDNFENLAAKGTDIEDCEVEDVVEQFDNVLSQSEQAEIIEELCQMSPDDITTYLKDLFAVPACNNDDDDDDDDSYYIDDDDIYKGVAF